MESADGSGAYDHTQTWFDADRDAYLIVTTNIDQAPTIAEEFRTPADTAGWAAEWETAYFVRTATDAYSHLHLAGSGGFVQVQALHLDRSELLDIASTMRRRAAPQPGWDLPGLPDVFQRFAESGDAPRAVRKLVWTDSDDSIVAELTVATEYSEAIRPGWEEDATVDTIDLDGTTAVVAESTGHVAISWPIDDDIQALFGFAGDRSTAESIVRSLEVVDDGAWQRATQPRDPQADGCQSLFC